MTYDEVITILDICQMEWPQSFAKLDTEDFEGRAKLWAAMFADDDARLVGAALKTIIAAGNREFAPGVGQIKEQMRKLVSNGEKTEAEAWARILKAIRNSAYDSARQFERLPPILQKIVGSPSQLREWGMMDSETLHSVVASNVQRAYRTMQQRENEAKKIPSDVAKCIAEFSQKFALEGHSGRDNGRKNARMGGIRAGRQDTASNGERAICSRRRALGTGNVGAGQWGLLLPS